MQRDMLCKVITANSTNSSSYSIHIIILSNISISRGAVRLVTQKKSFFSREKI